ncbi:MAG TPA: hypothetical protein VJI96_00965 [Candidatus Andersenbacteria bacterium]|nr:hypothetical protein [Candidatus Andersenbacteria bacterium]
MKKRRLHHRISYFTSSFSIVIGVVLIWRGIWYILDFVVLKVFGGDQVITSIAAILIGFLVLYLPDKDLKELRKL